MTSSNPSAYSSLAASRRAGLSAFAAATTIGLPERRSSAATASSSAVSPSCASTQSTSRSASSTASCAWARTNRAISVPGAPSMPPVSTTVKSRPLHSVSA